MTLREIDRQFEHWAIYPPPAFALLRIGCALGLPAPERPSSAPDRQLTETELLAIARQFGVAPPEDRHGG